MPSLVCAACGDPITEDQTALRMSAGVATDHGTFSGIFRPDVYLHAGKTVGPWGEDTGERWCAGPDQLKAALWSLYLDATSGASGSYGGE